MTRILHSIPLFYVLLLLPGWLPISDLFTGEWYYAQMMHRSGLLAVQYLIATVAVTPVLLIINRAGRGKALGRWLMVRRRHLGLISFIFGVVHLLHYLRYTYYDASQILHDAGALKFAVGWGAVLIFAALAVTSNGWSVRKLGRNWKRLHWWVYPAAALSFGHWYLFDFNPGELLFWLAVLAAVKLVHIALHQLRAPRRKAA